MLKSNQLFPTTLVVAILFCTLGGSARGSDISFDTDTGKILVDGIDTEEINGVQVLKAVVQQGSDGDIFQFRFLGDLSFKSTDVVTASGSRPLSLYAGNDVNIAAGTVLNFDAVGSPGNLGGGSGGTASTTLSVGGDGGDGAAFGGGGGLGGTFGEATVTGIGLTCDCESGGAGNAGTNGNRGDDGEIGQSGISGGSGLAGFAGTTPGTGGKGGVGGSAGIGSAGGSGGSLGSGGAGGGVFTAGQDGVAGGRGANSNIGGTGGDGSNGSSGTSGTNNAFGVILSGGAGGGAGGNGGAGGGAGGAGSGGGGGGGGGGGAGGNGISVQSGGSGGRGGFGEPGGDGAQGTSGIRGTRGGAGGGAVEIRAQGVIRVAGQVRANGADGSAAVPNPQTVRPLGTNVTISNDGEFGGIGSFVSGTGGSGGDGGAGATGGRGGLGGDGGGSGGGAGGTILFRGAKFEGAGGVASVGGGQQNGNGAFADPGRVVVAANALNPTLASMTVGAFESYSGQGGGFLNPFIATPTTTLNLPGLKGGADAFGVFEDATSTDPLFDNINLNAPANAIAAVFLSSEDAHGNEYDDHSSLMLINLSDDPLLSPKLGVTSNGDTNFQQSLLTRGYKRNPLFGGNGDTVLQSLTGNSIYTTLVPDDSPLVFNVSGSGNSLSAPLSEGAFVYLLTQPTGVLGDFDFDGDVDVDDVDFYSGKLDQLASGALAQLDLDGDNQITLADHDLHVTTLVETSNGQKGALLGDANLDGTVNVLIDAATVVQNLGDTVTSWSDGDFNADQIVNVLGDAALLVNNLGQNNTTSVSPAASSVPEPTAGLLLAVTTIASCFRRRR